MSYYFKKRSTDLILVSDTSLIRFLTHPPLRVTVKLYFLLVLKIYSPHIYNPKK